MILRMHHLSDSCGEERAALIMEGWQFHLPSVRLLGIRMEDAYLDNLDYTISFI